MLLSTAGACVLAAASVALGARAAAVEPPHVLAGPNILVSRDGPSPKGELMIAAHPVANPHAHTPTVAFAADTESNRFRDRMYAIWDDNSSGHSRIMLSFSTSRGTTWSAARSMASDAASSDQFRGAVAIAGDGTVGVSWLDDRDPAGLLQYFAASTDGGESFSPPVRVSSEPSPPRAAGNLTFQPTIDSASVTREGAQNFAVGRIAERFPDGGDYVGLIADAEGVFHPFWKIKPAASSPEFFSGEVRFAVNAPPR